MAALGAQALKDMGFTNVSYMEGGMRGWKEAGLPTNESAGE
jgi:rhodanese-related sulfurtransferase